MCNAKWVKETIGSVSCGQTIHACGRRDMNDTPPRGPLHMYTAPAPPPPRFSLPPLLFFQQYLSTPTLLLLPPTTPCAPLLKLETHRSEFSPPWITLSWPEARSTIPPPRQIPSRTVVPLGIPPQAFLLTPSSPPATTLSIGILPSPAPVSLSNISTPPAAALIHPSSEADRPEASTSTSTFNPCSPHVCLDATFRRA